MTLREDFLLRMDRASYREHFGPELVDALADNRRLLDAYRDEVLREAAAKIRAEADTYGNPASTAHDMRLTADLIDPDVPR